MGKDSWLKANRIFFELLAISIEGLSHKKEVISVSKEFSDFGGIEPQSIASPIPLTIQRSTALMGVSGRDAR